MEECFDWDRLTCGGGFQAQALVKQRTLDGPPVFFFHSTVLYNSYCTNNISQYIKQYQIEFYYPVHVEEPTI